MGRLGMNPVVTLYTRPGCHLCDEARDGIAQLAAEGLGLELREVDIDTDDRLLREYLERIPVVEVAGAIVSELMLDVEVLRTALAEADTLRA